MIAKLYFQQRATQQLPGTRYLMDRACLPCKRDTLHEIERYRMPTANLRSYKFTCRRCYHTGEE